MDQVAVLRTVAGFRDALVRTGIRPQRIILFGSLARGEGSPHSDIDLVVISDDFAGKSHWERILILSDAIYEQCAPIDAVALTPAEWELGESRFVEYARDGVTLHAA